MTPKEIATIKKGTAVLFRVPRHSSRGLLPSKTFSKLGWFCEDGGPVEWGLYLRSCRWRCVFLDEDADLYNTFATGLVLILPNQIELRLL